MVNYRLISLALTKLSSSLPVGEYEKTWGNNQIASGGSKVTGIKSQLGVANRYSS